MKRNVFILLVLVVSLTLNIILGAMLVYLVQHHVENEVSPPVQKPIDTTSTPVNNSSAEKTIYNDDYDFHTNLIYDEYLSFFQLNTSQADVVFLGDSLTARFPLYELAPDIRLLNRGIGSDVSAGCLARIGEILSHNPEKVFIWVGVNDIVHNIDPHDTSENVRKILKVCKANGVQAYLLSVIPVLKERHVTNNSITTLNKMFQDVCEDEGIKYINLYNVFLTEEGNPDSNKYIKDGIHININGYITIYNLLLPYINDSVLLQ